MEEKERLKLEEYMAHIGFSEVEPPYHKSVAWSVHLGKLKIIFLKPYSAIPEERSRAVLYVSLASSEKKNSFEKLVQQIHPWYDSKVISKEFKREKLLTFEARGEKLIRFQYPTLSPLIEYGTSSRLEIAQIFSKMSEVVVQLIPYGVRVIGVNKTMTSYYLFSEDVLDKVVRISDHRSINEKGKYSILYDNQNVDVEWIVEKRNLSCS